MSNTSQGNITYGKTKPWLQSLHLVWKTRKSFVEPLLGLPEWWFLELASSPWAPHKLCSRGEGASQVTAAATSVLYGAHVTHSNGMNSLQDSHGQGRPDTLNGRQHI